MITESDLQEAIAECEGQRNPTSSTCIKLAAFYTIRDNLYPQDRAEEPVFYSRAAGPVVEWSSNTEFGQFVADHDINNILPVIDDLMDTIQVLYPRLYAGVMRKLFDNAE